jgi:hypothetical protein
MCIAGQIGRGRPLRFPTLQELLKVDSLRFSIVPGGIDGCLHAKGMDHINASHHFLCPADDDLCSNWVVVGSEGRQLLGECRMQSCGWCDPGVGCRSWSCSELVERLCFLASSRVSTCFHLLPEHPSSAQEFAHRPQKAPRHCCSRGRQ